MGGLCVPRRKAKTLRVRRRVALIKLQVGGLAWEAVGTGQGAAPPEATAVMASARRGFPLCTLAAVGAGSQQASEAGVWLA